MATLTHSQKFSQLCEAFEHARAKLRIPGASLGVLMQGEYFTAGFGVTNAEHPLPVMPDTLFQVGSITKTFVGSLAMRLVEKGLLDLDAPIVHTLPSFALADAAATQGATVRHCLNHTGGWLGDWFNDCGEGDDAIARIVGQMAQLEQLTPLGEKWSYNNVGFALAARVFEQITGKTFEQLLQDEIFTPLNLRHTFIFPNDVMTQRFAVGHHVTPEGVLVARPWQLGRASHPPGGIISTVGDLLIYAQTHMGVGGAGFLSPASLRHMQTPTLEATGLYQMGLTWWVGQAASGAFVEHGGATNGQIALLRLVPSHGFAVAILTNAGVGRALTAELGHLAMQIFLGEGMPDSPLTPAQPALAEYCGHYVARLNEVNVTEKDGKLWLTVRALGRFPRPDSPPPPPPLDVSPLLEVGFYAPDRLVDANAIASGARGEFVRDAAGAVVWLRWGGRLLRRVGN